MHKHSKEHSKNCLSQLTEQKDQSLGSMMHSLGMMNTVVVDWS